LYNKIKHDIVLEEYVIQEKNFKNKQLIAKFRTSDHCLQIETNFLVAGLNDNLKKSDIHLLRYYK
jgi:hypothetical protein